MSGSQGFVLDRANMAIVGCSLFAVRFVLPDLGLLLAETETEIGRIWHFFCSRESFFSALLGAKQDNGPGPFP